MFKLLGDKPDHPMYDLAEAGRLLAELPPDQPLKALDELSFWLDSLQDTAGFKPEVRAAIVMLMDEASRPFQSTLLQQYLAEPHQQDFHGLHLWKNLHEHARGLAETYTACLFEYSRTERRSAAYREMLPQLCVRQLIASANRMKFELMRYLQVDAAVWKQLAEGYRLAEAEQCADAKVVPFPGQSQHSSPKRELMAALVFYISSPGTLAPDQIESCARIASRLSGFFDLGLKAGVETPWRFDLAEPGIPHRDDGTLLTQGIRCFGAVRARPALLKIVEQNESDPVWLEHRTASDFTPSGKLTLLKHLHLYWDETPPHRHSERRGIETFVDVAHGFRLLCQLVTHIEAVRGDEDIGLTEPQKIECAAETWSVADISKDGLGVTLTRAEGAWIKIGDLCSIRPHNGPKWWVGMVRRLHADEQGKLHAGIEILSRNPASIWLRALGKGAETASNWETSSGSFKYTYLPVILMQGMQEDMGTSLMLMEPGGYVAGNVYQMMMGEQGRDVRLIRLLSEGEDFERVEFEWL